VRLSELHLRRAVLPAEGDLELAEVEGVAAVDAEVGLERALDEVALVHRGAPPEVLHGHGRRRREVGFFDEVDDELADIEPEARQKLIKRSFQHPATRAIQPAVWIPHDDLGVAKDEIQRTSAFTKRVWITSVNARLDAGGSVIYRGLPPDRDPFENIEV